MGPIDWSNQIVTAAIGFILGVLAGVLAHWQWDRHLKKERVKQLRQWYGAMAGSYENLNDLSGPTGGWIQISQNRDGSFTAIGMHASGKADWTSEINMSLEARNVGTGYYRHPRPGIDHGEQQISYYPETRELHVRGRNTSALTKTEFFHTWRPLPYPR